MSDIVERLRQVAAAYKSLPTSGIWATMTVDRDASCNNLTDAADEIERLRAEVAGLREDAERLDFLLHKLPGDSLRYVLGELSDTSDEAEFRAAIDAARKGEA